MISIAAQYIDTSIRVRHSFIRAVLFIAFLTSILVAKTHPRLLLSDDGKLAAATKQLAIRSTSSYFLFFIVDKVTLYL